MTHVTHVNQSIHPSSPYACPLGASLENIMTRSFSRTSWLGAFREHDDTIPWVRAVPNCLKQQAGPACLLAKVDSHRGHMSGESMTTICSSTAPTDKFSYTTPQIQKPVRLKHSKHAVCAVYVLSMCCLHLAPLRPACHFTHCRPSNNELFEVLWTLAHRIERIHPNLYRRKVWCCYIATPNSRRKSIFGTALIKHHEHQRWCFDTTSLIKHHDTTPHLGSFTREHHDTIPTISTLDTPRAHEYWAH